IFVGDAPGERAEALWRLCAPNPSPERPLRGRRGPTADAEVTADRRPRVGSCWTEHRGGQSARANRAARLGRTGDRRSAKAKERALGEAGGGFTSRQLSAEVADDVSRRRQLARDLVGDRDLEAGLEF